MQSAYATERGKQRNNGVVRKRDLYALDIVLALN